MHPEGLNHAHATRIARLNWGCGDHIRPGWIDSDRNAGPNIDIVVDIREGLPLPDDSIEYAVSIHALQELAYVEVVPALTELRRVLKPAGVLRLGLPDLQKAIRAYQDHDDDYFAIHPSEARSRGGRFVLHTLWFGHSRTLFTRDFIMELLAVAGFGDIVECGYRRTASPFADIVELDNREIESVFVEGTKVPGVAEPAGYNSRAMRGTAVRVVESSPLPGADEKLLGGSMRGMPADDGSLAVRGWVLGRQSKVTGVELVAGDEVVGSAELRVQRPDIAELFPDEPDAQTAGFYIVVEPEGRGVSELRACANLADGTKVPFHSMHVEVARRGLLRRRRG